LSKKSDAEPAAAPLWHPNFRNYERLPDTKTVRTALLVNLVAGTAAVVMLGWVGYREYEIHNMSQQQAEAETIIERDTAKNNEALRLSKLFTDEEKKFRDVTTFTTQTVRPSTFVLQIGSILPKEIALNFIDMRLADPTNPACVLRGLVAGSRTEAAGSATSFVELLRAQKEFVPVFESIELTNVAPDPRGGFLTFEIVMKLRNPKKKAAKEENIVED